MWHHVERLKSVGSSGKVSFLVDGGNWVVTVLAIIDRPLWEGGGG